MAETTADPPARISGPVSFARLHGMACWYCGTVNKTMYAAGHITLEGRDRVWPIVTCGCQGTA